MAAVSESSTDWVDNTIYYLTFGFSSTYLWAHCLTSHTYSKTVYIAPFVEHILHSIFLAQGQISNVPEQEKNIYTNRVKTGTPHLHAQISKFIPALTFMSINPLLSVGQRPISLIFHHLQGVTDYYRLWYPFILSHEKAISMILAWNVINSA